MTLKVVSFGGGVNSTALLLGLLERGERPDLILFADTGNEFEETYEHVGRIGVWSLRHFGTPLVTVHRAFHRHLTLEDECYNLRTLPSKAFGYSGCSVKWKRQVMDRYIKRNWPEGRVELGAKRSIDRLIGIDAGEAHRGKIPDTAQFRYRYPLIEWDWARDECIDAIKRHDLAVPRKSACFFCPATKKHEVLALAKERPDLFARAVAIEDQAYEAGTTRVGTTRGLGRTWTWRELVESKHPELLPETPYEYCVDCSDGITDD